MQYTNPLKQLDMKKTIILIVFVALAALVSAQYHSYSATNRPSGQEQSFAGTATYGSPVGTHIGSYTGSYTMPTTTIYEPFSNETPSSGMGPNRAPGEPGVTGDQQTYDDPTINPNPIGDAVLPLILLSLFYAGIMMTRRRKRA